MSDQPQQNTPAPAQPGQFSPVPNRPSQSGLFLPNSKRPSQPGQFHPVPNPASLPGQFHPVPSPASLPGNHQLQRSPFPAQPPQSQPTSQAAVHQPVQVKEPFAAIRAGSTPYTQGQVPYPPQSVQRPPAFVPPVQQPAQQHTSAPQLPQQARQQPPMAQPQRVVVNPSLRATATVNVERSHNFFDKAVFFINWWMR